MLIYIDNVDIYIFQSANKMESIFIKTNSTY